MNPAISVILLTTLIGAGQGLFLALVAAAGGAALGVLPEAPAAMHRAGALLAFGLLAAGLGASFFHLGRPARAWRTATRWRSSWLSREVIALPLCMGLVLLHALAHHPAGTVLRSGLWWIDVLGVLATIALFVCTGMIYACLRFVQEWASALTVVNFVLLGSASGFTLATALAATLAPGLLPFFDLSAIALAVLALAGCAAALARNARLRPKSSLATAIGIKHPVIEQRAAGFLGGSFNTREFFHGRSAATLRGVRHGFLLLAFPLPVALLLGGAADASTWTLVGAFGLQYAGLLAERWYFFAQAQHPQNLYYRATE